MTATPIDILLVDDESRNLDALEAILGESDYRLLRAEDADTALRLLLDHDVAAIVLDIQMPGVSGFDLAQMIKKTKRFRETPILFLTAYMSDDQHVAKGYGAGAVDYLTKPLNPKILRHKIAVFAELFRKTRALAELNEKLEDRVRERTAELEKSEAALRAADQQKDQFLAVLAHELRNPLAPLRTGLDIVLRQQASTPVVTRTLSVMNRQLDHMVRLIDDLLDVSRISRGLLDLKKERLDIRTAIEGAIDSFRPLFERKRQVLSSALGGALFVHGDATRVAQIIGNLLHNATKFTPDGGSVSVALTRDGANAVVQVTDSGIGIPPGQTDRVFAMFARIERPGSPAQPGLGIGLALARRLAEMHAGTLDVSSLGDDRGSTFTLTLPLLEDGEERASDTTPVTTATSRRVVVIEDNEDVAETLMDWLALEGHRAWVAHTGESGVGLVQEVRPELVLCDLGLPGIDGLEVCRRVRRLPLDEQPFMVALTGWGRQADRDKTKEAGFNHHVVKPVSPDTLDGVLRMRASHGTRPRTP